MKCAEESATTTADVSIEGGLSESEYLPEGELVTALRREPLLSYKNRFFPRFLQLRGFSSHRRIHIFSIIVHYRTHLIDAIPLSLSLSLNRLLCRFRA